MWVLHYFLQSFLGKFSPPYEFKEFIKQCYIIGYKSIPVAITGFIMGLVLTLQSRPT
jgi:phospholipid/cholesterol/gamma-HCH transport system permease protein